MSRNVNTVLVVNSANENHSSLNLVTTNTVTELTERGYQVLMHHLWKQPISFCTDCGDCYSSDDKACPHDDNFNAFTANLLKADIVLFAVPVLWDTPHAILQALLDKFSAFLATDAMFGGHDFFHKKWAFIGVSSEPCEVVDSVKENIGLILESFEWEYLGSICLSANAHDFESAADESINVLADAISYADTQTRSERYYQMFLDDYSADPFKSAGKPYYGTMDQIASFFDGLRANSHTANHFAMLLTSFDRYQKGETTVQHTIANSPAQLLNAVKILGTKTSVQENHKWIHDTDSEKPYDMECDKAESTHIWLKTRMEYYRCVATRFTNIRYKSGEEYQPLGDKILGHPGQILGEPGNLRSQLFVVEKCFLNEDMALADMKDFEANPDPDFSSILEDVFANT